jgi:hypothetical protein
VNVDVVATGRRIDFRVTGAKGHPASEFYVDATSLRERVK